jgi:hypothetical protein
VQKHDGAHGCPLRGTQFMLQEGDPGVLHGRSRYPGGKDSRVPAVL